VSSGGRSVRVQLVDWCACGGGRVIDLYASSVRALGLSLSSGVYRVEVSW
jgi:rare lipoprotein A (peptidoglycan hydrolase)